MDDHLTAFIDFMRAHNCGPANSAEIKASDKWVNYTIEGDPATKKKGRCKFKIEGIGVGCFTDWRSGEWIGYPAKGSRPPKEYTDEEKAAYKAKMEAISKAADAEKEAGYADGAKTAQDLYGASLPCVTHPYLERKNVKPHGIRQHGDDLVIPMMDKNDIICSVQTIGPDGEKSYHWKGKKGFFIFAAADENFDVIVVAEGWATCASIREATGLPVICAFDCTSLRSVALAIRRKYPKAKIILGADNDQY